MNRARRQIAAGSALLGAWAVSLAVFSPPAVSGPAERPLPAASERLDRGSLEDRAFVPGQAIVRFRAGTGPAERLEARAASGAEFERALRIPRAQVVEVEGGVRRAVERLRERPEVVYAQPNYVYRALADPPNDPRFSQLWGLGAIDVLAAWDATRGEGQSIAIVDTGVDLTHPDLAPRLWVNPSPGPAGDVHGYDFVDDDGDPDDYQFHGTHVAGTAAAAAGNGIGIAGVAPAARIMAVRVLDASGRGTTAGVADGVDYAAEKGAGVINLSLGAPIGEDPDPALSDAVKRAGTEFDAVVVAAAGNGGADGIGDDNDLEPQSPCQSVDATRPPNLVCVAATQADGQLTSFSNWGADSVHLAAPGQEIWSARAPYARVFPTGDAPEGFEDGEAFDSTWTRFVETAAWGRDSEIASKGDFSAADSPGSHYSPSADASLVTRPAFDASFAGRAGCRMHFDLRLKTAGDDGDVLAAGLLHDEDQLSYHAFDADTVGDGLRSIQLPFNDLDGNAAVAPAFLLDADGDGTVGEGANVDEVELLCRSTVYGSSSYRSLSGTSMAAPHVAGVAALVRAAVPGATAAQTVGALLAGVKPLVPTPGKPTTTNGIVSAAGALAAAGWVASPPSFPSPAPGSAGTPGPVAAAGPGSPELGASPARLRVSRARRVAYRFRADPGLRGVVVMRTRVRAVTTGGRLRRLRHFTLARERFVVPANGRAVARFRLTPRQLRVLRLNGRLRLLVDVTVRSADGRSATATRRLLLLPPLRG